MTMQPKVLDKPLDIPFAGMQGLMNVISLPSCPFRPECSTTNWEQTTHLQDVVDALQTEQGDLRQALSALSLSFASLWSNYEAYSSFVGAIRVLPLVVAVWTAIINRTIHVTTMLAVKDHVQRNAVYDAEMAFMDRCPSSEFDFSVRVHSPAIEGELESEGWQCLFHRPRGA